MLCLLLYPVHDLLLDPFREALHLVVLSEDLLEKFHWSQNHYALYVRLLNLKDYDQESGEIYQCNICDTEACNSWGTDAMPDPQADNSAFSSVPNVFHLLSFTALLLALL